MKPRGEDLEGQMGFSLPYVQQEQCATVKQEHGFKRDASREDSTAAENNQNFKQVADRSPKQVSNSKTTNARQGTQGDVSTKESVENKESSTNYKAKLEVSGSKEGQLSQASGQAAKNDKGAENTEGQNSTKLARQGRAEPTLTSNGEAVSGKSPAKAQAVSAEKASTDAKIASQSVASSKGAGARAEKTSTRSSPQKTESATLNNVNSQAVEQEVEAAVVKTHGMRGAQQANTMTSTEQNTQSNQAYGLRTPQLNLFGLSDASATMNLDENPTLKAYLQLAKLESVTPRPRIIRSFGHQKNKDLAAATGLSEGASGASNHSASVATLTGTAAVTSAQHVGEVMLDRIENMQNLQKTFLRAKLGMADGTKIDVSIRTAGEEVRVVINVPNAELKQAMIRDWKRLSRKASEKGINLGDPLIQVQPGQTDARFEGEESWTVFQRQAV